MMNPNHHKTGRSTHGKFFKSLVPWKETDDFKERFFHDYRTGCPPKSMFTNNSMENIVNEHKKIEEISGLEQRVFDLKDQTVLRDDKLKFVPSQGANRVTYIYNDYHRKMAKDGFSRNPGGGRGWFH